MTVPPGPTRRADREGHPPQLVLSHLLFCHSPSLHDAGSDAQNDARTYAQRQGQGLIPLPSPQRVRKMSNGSPRPQTLSRVNPQFRALMPTQPTRVTYAG